MTAITQPWHNNPVEYAGITAAVRLGPGSLTGGRRSQTLRASLAARVSIVSDVSYRILMPNKPWECSGPPDAYSSIKTENTDEGPEER